MLAMAKRKTAAQLQREIDTMLADPDDEAERAAQAELAEQQLQRKQRAEQGDWKRDAGATTYEGKLRYWDAYAKRWGLAEAVKHARDVVASNFIGRDFGETAASFYARSPAARATKDWLHAHV